MVKIHFMIIKCGNSFTKHEILSQNLKEGTNNLPRQN